MFEAIDLNVSAPVITESLMRRIRSREENNFTDRMLSIMRNEFGGHAVKEGLVGSSQFVVRTDAVELGTGNCETVNCKLQEATMATMQMKVRPEDLSQVPQGQERIPEPGILVIFGASGDLTKRKLLPALFHLQQADLLPKQFAIVGVARRPLGDEFAADMRAGIVEFGGVDASDPKLDDFVQHISYFPLNFDDPADYAGLKAELDRIDKEKRHRRQPALLSGHGAGVLCRHRREPGRAGHGAAGERASRRW